MTSLLPAIGFSLAAAFAAGPRPPDVALYQQVLQAYVQEDGLVRYAALRHDIAGLDEFVRQIAPVSPRSHPGLFPSRESKLAYWINAYNALVLWAFARDYPEKKGRLQGLFGRGVFFYRMKFTVGGEKRSLASIENEIIRKEFREPRIHFALVCASSSCPKLSRQAYTEKNLETLLETETRRFLNEPRNVAIDATRRVITLSKLFDWYKEDFGRTQREMLDFLARYRESDRSSLSENGWRIQHFEYDWSPNAATER
jgi:hypothetical protein